MSELADVFAELEDPRAANARRHSVHDILVIALCTMVCGGQTCTDMELFGHAKREFPQSFLKLENGIPSHDTFSRVLGKLDPEAFRGWFLGFGVVSGVHGAICPGGPGGGGGGRQDPPAFLRPGGRALAFASGQRLGGGAKVGVGATGR